MLLRDWLKDASCALICAPKISTLLVHRTPTPPYHCSAEVSSVAKDHPGPTAATLECVRRPREENVFHSGHSTAPTLRYAVPPPTAHVGLDAAVLTCAPHDMSRGVMTADLRRFYPAR